MQQLDLIFGFSELKELLIRKYQIERDREFVRLYFSEKNNELVMHDYHEHRHEVILCFSIEKNAIRKGLKSKAHLLVHEALMHRSSSQFLNEGFQLSGFFKL